MASSEELAILIKAKDHYSKVTGQANRSFSKLGSALKALGKAGIVGGAGIAAGLALATKSAMDFEKQFAEVQTLLPNVDTAGIKQLKSDILDVSKEFGIAAGEAVPALYSAISAGVPPGNVLDFMGVAAKASIGGVTSLETAVDGLTSVVNSYGEGVIDAQQAADVMFTAVKLGKTDFEQLSKSLFNVLPTAASLGVGLEEVAASLAVMTAQGVPTSVATTGLRQAFVEASKSGTKLDKAIKEVAGGSFAELISKGGGAADIFEQMRRAMPEQEFKDLFGSVEAMNTVLQVTGPNAAAVKSALAEMGASAGAVDTAFGTMSDTTAFKTNKAFNEIKVLMIEVGSVVLPKVSGFISGVMVPALTRFGDWFQANKDQIRRTIEKVGAALGALSRSFKEGLDTIMPPLRAFGDWILGNKVALVVAITAVGTAILVALGPGALAVAAIVGVITLIGWFKDNWERVWEGVRTFFEGKIEFIRSIIDSKFGWLLPTGALIKGILFFRDKWDEIWGGIAGGFGAIADGIVNTFKGAINGIVGAINTLIGGWNAISFSMPSLDLGPLGNVGGWKIGVPQIPTIPELARGGEILGGGMAIVGERGRELLNLPRGATVTPLSSGASGGGGPIVVQLRELAEASEQATEAAESVAGAAKDGAVALVSYAAGLRAATVAADDFANVESDFEVNIDRVKLQQAVIGMSRAFGEFDDLVAGFRRRGFSGVAAVEIATILATQRFEDAINEAARATEVGRATLEAYQLGLIDVKEAYIISSGELAKFNNDLEQSAADSFVAERSIVSLTEAIARLNSVSKGGPLGVSSQLAGPGAFAQFGGLEGLTGKALADAVEKVNKAIRDAAAETIREREVPGFAGGVQNFRGGLAVVGERGPELVRLSRGVDVLPSSNVRTITGATINGGIHVSVAIEGDASREDANAIADRIVQKIDEQLGADAMMNEQSRSA